MPTKRLLGAYYTPDRVALLLTKWALDGRIGRILDPSFGGCSFLRASMTALHEAGTDQPGALVYGVDIDVGAMRFAQSLMALGVHPENIMIHDFLGVKPSDFPNGLFRAIAGNPPYVRHQWVQDSTQELVSAVGETMDMLISGRSALWVYFIAHSMQFLEDEGRLAFLVPGSILHADYTAGLFDKLRSAFARTTIIRLAERLFPDAEEASVILLASGFGRGPGATTFSESATVDGLEVILSRPPSIDSVELNQDPRDWKTTVISEKARALLRKLRTNDKVKILGSLAKVRLGVVTGANSFFLRPADFLQGKTLDGVTMIPAITRGQLLRTRQWTDADQRALDNSAKHARMLAISPDATLTDELSTEVQNATMRGIPSRYKCALRNPWYALSDVAPPDAFLAYMGSTAPRIVINQAHASCTNAIHRIWWKGPVESAERVAVGTWTSLFQLEAELAGRSYGGGVLKVEPGAAIGLAVPVVSRSEAHANDIDCLSRCGKIEQARALADRVVLWEGLGLDRGELTVLREAIDCLVQRRISNGASGDDPNGDTSFRG